MNSMKLPGSLIYRKLYPVCYLARTLPYFIAETDTFANTLTILLQDLAYWSHSGCLLIFPLIGHSLDSLLTLGSPCGVLYTGMSVFTLSLNVTLICMLYRCPYSEFWSPWRQELGINFEIFMRLTKGTSFDNSSTWSFENFGFPEIYISFTYLSCEFTLSFCHAEETRRNMFKLELKPKQWR